MPQEADSLPPERYRGQRIALLSHVPPWAHRILMVGTDKGRVGHLLKKRPHVEVHGIEPDAHDAQLAAQMLDSAINGTAENATLPFDQGSIDLILLLDPVPGEGLVRGIARMSPFLGQYGRTMVLGHSAEYWRGAPANALTPEYLDELARETGCLVFTRSASTDPMYQVSPGAAGHPDQVDLLVTMVRPDYAPLDHARSLNAAGRPDWAYVVFRETPERYLESEETQLAVQTEMLGCLLDWGSRGMLDTPDRLYCQAIEMFYAIVKKRPCHAVAYDHIAGIWKLMGAPEMAARLLRSLQHAAPSGETERKIKKLPAGRLRRAEHTPPVWTPGDSKPRVLFVIHPRPHYGLDVLFDGLCTVLGSENVVDFPPKPTLHGHIDPVLANYPCHFDLPDHGYTLEQAVDELDAGKFNFVLYGDCERGLPRRTARALADALGQTPLFLVDQRDEFFDCAKDTLEYLGVSECAAYFKREMLACLDYGKKAIPLPFAYPDGRIPESVEEEREHLFFWAGHRNFSLRRLYLEQIERTLGEQFDATFTPSEYALRLRNSKVGLNCFGMGFDTVRYWELPAHGCLLLSERLPILVPHDFRDGETALFFDDAAELDRKLTYLRRYPEVVGRIAKAGREHLLRHHTGSARARHLLGWIKSKLEG